MSAQISQIFPHYAPVLAGAAERFRRYSPGLLERGILTSVITSRSHEELPENECVDGIIPVHRMKVGDVPEMRDKHLFLQAANALRQQKNISVVQTIKSDRKLIQNLWRIKKQGKSLLFVSTMVENEAWGRTFFHQWINQKIQSLSQRLFDAIVVGSSVMGDTQLHMGARREQLHIISHGVDTKRFSPAAEISPKSMVPSLPDDAKICLFVGNLIPRKGILMILEVWPSVIKANPNAWLILVGARQRPTISFETERLEIEAYQKAIFKLIAEVPQILYVGEQTNIERWYQIANLFVFPSLQEGFPNALLEAMSTGLPCLTNRFLGFPAGELGETQGIIEVVNASKEAWSKAILDLLEKKDLRVLKGISARKLVQEKHELTCTLDKYAKLYELLALSSKIPSE